MIAEILLLLSKSVMAACDVPCDCSSEQGSSESCSVECNTGSFSKFDCDDSFKKLAEIQSFICSGVCPTAKACKPYLEFANIAVFMTKIPNAKKLKKLYYKCDINGLLKYASSCGGVESYDALSAFFYNADSRSGISCLKFDSNYILFFLQRFYYFLDLISDNLGSVSNNNLVCNKTNKPFDLLCPPCTYTNLNFGIDSHALSLFNTIIGNAVISDLVVAFVRILLYQLHQAACRCAEQHCDPSAFTTFGLYIDLLRNYLLKTSELSAVNALYVQNFGTSQASQDLFCWLPYNDISATTNLLTGMAALGVISPPEQYINAGTYNYLNRRSCDK